MRNTVYNIFIVLLVVANLLTCSLIYVSRKPKCICDDCYRARGTGSLYCKEHIDRSYEREICLEVINRN